MEPNYRRCLSCRKVCQKGEFWRVVRVYPSRKVQLDEGMGRSAYLCPQASCLVAAQKKNRLGRILQASVPEQLYETLQQRLAAIPTAQEHNLEGDNINRGKLNASGEPQQSLG
jgi:predicted RNA-binding protein YlxR (DUF448 family)